VTESVLTAFSPVVAVVTELTPDAVITVETPGESVLTVVSPVATVVNELIQDTDVVTEILLASGPQGSVGPAGATGPQSTRFVFNQATPAASWYITHNLDTYPVVTVVIDGQEVITDVEYVDAFTVYLTFPSPVAGSAYLY
jgi:hypothetical protein